MPHIRAVIFDMDGLLIDTEPLWREAEISVLASVGVQITEQQALDTMGVRISQIVDLYYARHPWSGPSRAEVARRVEDYVIQHVSRSGEPKPGACEALAVAFDAHLPIAIASSSSERLIRAVVQRLNIGDYIEVICSAEVEEEGKPHPAVYLSTARRLGVPPESCLALEDSPNGVLSAKAAGMYCIAVPDPHMADDPRMCRADLRLDSLEAFVPEILQRIQQSTVR